MGIVIDGVGEKAQRLRLTRPLPLALAHEAQPFIHSLSIPTLVHVFPGRLDSEPPQTRRQLVFDSVPMPPDSDPPLDGPMAGFTQGFTGASYN
jgi:hypothetical protein